MMDRIGVDFSKVWEKCSSKIGHEEISDTIRLFLKFFTKSQSFKSLDTFIATSISRILFFGLIRGMKNSTLLTKK
jgi:hypothetical protein